MVDVGFGYTKENMLFSDVNFGVSTDTRLAILGKNGSGKSTLLKLIMGELNATVSCLNVIECTAWPFFMTSFRVIL